ncbi:hypothetical protein HYDPIDRAFT_116674 [Hydnomerulius pinastri MD-312]|uniref:Uncharacterized protein n=1 Tax=Hydnomerulius pinastri MD-312 TaxID=994086 RepID=A0A0C9WAZ9_9AGAM|nr:hypothetical protein HYDPIDRAFT_116674 [Hydnomerulius pinastri MD-312]
MIRLPLLPVLLLARPCYASPFNATSAVVDSLVSVSVCNTRTIWSIILNCLLSLAACTWNAVHPNIPGTEEGRGTVFLRRLGIIAFAVILPELYLIWALHQHYSAKKAARDFNAWRKAQQESGVSGKDWSQTHGFFLDMGGFQLYVKGHSYCPLTLQELLHFVEQGDVSLPDITEEDIWDRSKGDFVNKGFAMFQLAWFVFQFIVRLIYKLPPTLLEVDTFALVVLGFAGWYFWWKKPKDVGRPYCVNWKGVGAPGQLVFSEITHEFKSWHTVLAAADGVQKAAVSPAAVKSRRVPSLYKGYLGNRRVFDKLFRLKLVVGCFGGVAFGGIHCISWNFQFPTHIEQSLWHIACIFILCIPVSIAAVMAAYSIINVYQAGRLTIHIHAVLHYLFCVLFLVYVLARGSIIVLLLLSFRSLPSGVYDTVCWTSSVPHLFS